MLLIVNSLIIAIAIVSADPPLPTYELDQGAEPYWMTPEEALNAHLNRWYIHRVTIQCLHFIYYGSLGNFNNFPSKESCLDHLKHKPEEQLLACQEDEDRGKCDPGDLNMVTRWRFDPDTGKCVEFPYTGCGGNANNFLSEQECLDACQNAPNGGITEVPGQFTEYPNAFDCTFRPEVDTEDPDMGIVVHDTDPKCVYAAIKKNAIVDRLVEACKSGLPFQITIEIGSRPFTVDAEIEIYFYYDPTTQTCMPYESKRINKEQLESGDYNAFSSPEMCASFCPAVKQVGPLKANEPCLLEKVGECPQDGPPCEYALDRWHYAHSELDSVTGKNGVCKQFAYNAKEYNLNNFKSQAECEAICRDPLAAAAA